MLRFLKLLRYLAGIDKAIEKAKKEGKPWYKSKTIWVNLIALIVSLLSMKGIKVSPEEQSAIVTGILAFVNIILRLVTREPVKV